MRRRREPAHIGAGLGEDEHVPTIPDSTKNSLHGRLASRARER
jgi:hypothetical protein